MKRLAVAVIFAFVMAVSAVSAQSTAQIGRSTIAYPAQAELDRFPIIWTKNPAQAEVRRTLGALGLRLEVLKVEWTGYNWYRHLNRFVYETIPVGTLVYVDSAGIPRYREDCGNRLVEPAKCPQCGTVGLTDSTSNGLIGTPAVTTDTVINTSAKVAGLWGRMTDSLKGMAVGFWKGLGSIFAPLFWILLFLAGVALLLWLAMLIIGWLQGLRGTERRRFVGAEPPFEPVVSHYRGTTTAPNPVPPVVTPTPPATPVPEITPTLTTAVPVAGSTATPATPAPTGEAQSERRFVAFYPGEPGSDTMLRFGGVKNVRFEEQDGETTIRFRQK